MIKKFVRVMTAIVFILTALGISALILLPQDGANLPTKKEQLQTRIIRPQQVENSSDHEEAMMQDTLEELITYEERLRTKIALKDGELLISLLIDNFDDDPEEEQVIAYRNLKEKESPIYVTYIKFDTAAQEYKRIWSAATAATRPGTISLYTQDLIGDRNKCILLTGMNGAGEYTLTVFRNSAVSEKNTISFKKIAELHTYGTISVQEIQRIQAYQYGYAQGQSFPIIVRSRGDKAITTLDQQEITYTYNMANGSYEQSKVVQIPGRQVEQRRLQELLSNAKAFEEFIDGLWYYVSSQGTLDNRQYIYFDPQNKEVIFYGDEAQQVFAWQNSSATRYGLYIAAQNISVTTLRRSLDIELESLDSIKVKVFEDVRLKINVNASWDGSYRKVRILESSPEDVPSVSSYINTQYNGAIGKLYFFENGFYELDSERSRQKGRYAFFLLDNQELLELRPENIVSKIKIGREIYLVERSKKAEGTEEGVFRENLTLSPVRVGIQGIQKLHENAIFLVENDPTWEEPPQQTFQAMLSTEGAEDSTGPILSFISQPQYFSPDDDGVNDELTMWLSAQAETPIASWRFEIREPQPPYLVFYRVEGKGSPPERIVWNGRSNKGELVQAATDYPFTYTAEDSEGHSSSLEGSIGVDVLVIRDETGNNLRIQVPSIIFRAGYADFVGLATETVENNNRVLRRIAEILNKFQDYKVLIEGHANRTQLDNQEEEQNELQPLSELRARAIVTRLTEFGVNRNRLSSVGMGSTNPIAAFEDRNNWWKNRRVEFILIK